MKIVPSVTGLRQRKLLGYTNLSLKKSECLAFGPPKEKYLSSI